MVLLQPLVSLHSVPFLLSVESGLLPLGVPYIPFCWPCLKTKTRTTKQKLVELRTPLMPPVGNRESEAGRPLNPASLTSRASSPQRTPPHRCSRVALLFPRIFGDCKHAAALVFVLVILWIVLCGVRLFCGQLLAMKPRLSS